LSRTESCRYRAVSHPRIVSGRHPQRGPRINGRHSSYGWLQLPSTTAGVLAVTLVRGCPLPTDRCSDLRVYVFSMSISKRSGSIRPRTLGVSVPLAMTRHGLFPAGATNPSPLPTVLFGAQHLQGRLHPLPLHLACLRAYASTCPLPSTPQGSILGSRLTIAQAGLPPARTRGLARPNYPLNLIERFWKFFKRQVLHMPSVLRRSQCARRTVALAADRELREHPSIFETRN
jgi:hypothetical protein